MSFWSTAELWLALADVSLLAIAGAGYFLLLGLRPPSAPDVPSAYGVLEASIGKYAPGIPVGYTWGEAFGWLKERGVKADWGNLDRRLEEYEAYRYGGKGAPGEGKDDVLGLSVKVRRSLIGKKSRRKSPRTG